MVFDVIAKMSSHWLCSIWYRYFSMFINIFIYHLIQIFSIWSMLFCEYLILMWVCLSVFLRFHSLLIWSYHLMWSLSSILVVNTIIPFIAFYIISYLCSSSPLFIIVLLYSYRIKTFFILCYCNCWSCCCCCTHSLIIDNYVYIIYNLLIKCFVLLSYWAKNSDYLSC